MRRHDSDPYGQEALGFPVLSLLMCPPGLRVPAPCGCNSPSGQSGA